VERECAHRVARGFDWEKSTEQLERALLLATARNEQRVT
jgi:hypothetical protein